MAFVNLQNHTQSSRNGHSRSIQLRPVRVHGRVEHMEDKERMLRSLKHQETCLEELWTHWASMQRCASTICAEDEEFKSAWESVAVVWNRSIPSKIPRAAMLNRLKSSVFDFGGRTAMVVLEAAVCNWENATCAGFTLRSMSATAVADGEHWEQDFDNVEEVETSFDEEENEDGSTSGPCESAIRVAMENTPGLAHSLQLKEYDRWDGRVHLKLRHPVRVAYVVRRAAVNPARGTTANDT